MRSHDALWIVDATLKSRGFSEVGPGPADYEGYVTVHGQQVGIRISISDALFGTLPIVSLTHRSELKVSQLAHNTEGNGICYFSNVGLPLDMYQPGQAILRILEEVVRTIGLSLGKSVNFEIAQEYQRYWQRHDYVRCFVSRDSFNKRTETRFLTVKEPNGSRFLCLSDSKAIRGAKYTEHSKAQLWRIDVDLGPTSSIVVPRTLADLKTWICEHRELGPGSWQEAFGILSRREPLFIAAPNAFLGIELQIPSNIEDAVRNKRIRKHRLAKVLESRLDSIEIYRLSGKWCSLKDITERNIRGHQTLIGKSIALVGCGTVGGYLARMLVQCGAGNGAKFTLFDKDYLAEGNIGRHLLGFEHIGKAKSQALKTELERFHPDVQISAVTGNALERWHELSMHDIVIDATGEWNIQTALNEFFLFDKNTSVQALLHSWIYKNGASVQSFMNLRDEYACFRCLKIAFDSEWRYPASKGREEITVQPASCSDGAYVAYAVDVPNVAASLAMRAVLDWVTGNPGARLRTMVVDYRRGRNQPPVCPRPLDSCPACKRHRSSS